MAGRNAYLHQVNLGGIGAFLTERHVVLGGTTLVAMAFNGQLVIGIILQDVAQLGGIDLQGLDPVGAQGVLVVVEIGILNATQKGVDVGAGLRVRHTPRLHGGGGSRRRGAGAGLLRRGL